MHIFSWIAVVLEIIACALYIGLYLAKRNKERVVIPKIDALSIPYRPKPKPRKEFRFVESKAEKAEKLAKAKAEKLQRDIGRLKMETIRKKCPELHIPENDDMKTSAYRHLVDIPFDPSLLDLDLDNNTLVEEITTEHVRVAIPREFDKCSAQWIEPGEEILKCEVAKYHIVDIPAKKIVRSMGKFHHV